MNGMARMLGGMAAWGLVAGATGLLAACSGLGGAWPSLQTPAERTAAHGAAPATAVAGTASSATAPTSASPASAASASPAPASAAPGQTESLAAVAAVRARLDEAGRQLETVGKRWNEHEAEFRAAASAATGAKAGDAAWAAAQKTLTRLNQVAAQYGDVEETLLRASGELALAADQGGDASAALAQAGRLLRECRAAQARALATVQKGQGQIQR